jgi:glucose/arabinose dehydrogenase
MFSSHTLRLAITLLGLCLFSAPQAAPKALYRTSGDCNGYPRVELNTAPGLCVGLVATGLGFARGVVAVGDAVYVADMGGWHADRGRVLRLDLHNPRNPQVLLKGLNQPNGLAPGPDGSLYVGLAGKLIRFDPAAPNPAATVREVLTHLPGTGRHPLSAMALAPDGSLYVNVGAATDHCEGPGGAAPDPVRSCPELSETPPRASILHLRPGAQPVDAGTLKPYATGLRNSMALALLPDGRLLSANNARDYINLADHGLSDEELPHEPLLLVEEGADYGWPYCYDLRRPSPEYPRADCASKQAPLLLLPAHAAPLGMLLYHGAALPGMDKHLLIGYHGYRAKGHRIVSFGLDGQGLPTGEAQDLVSGWGYVEGSHPQGAPVGLWQLGDGSVLITEDHNGTLLRLAAGHPDERP